MVTSDFECLEIDPATCGKDIKDGDCIAAGALKLKVNDFLWWNQREPIQKTGVQEGAAFFLVSSYLARMCLDLDSLPHGVAPLNEVFSPPFAYAHTLHARHKVDMTKYILH